MRKSIFVDIISALFILLFVYAAVSKLLSFEQFQRQLGQSPLLTSFAGPVAWVVPAFELLIAVLLAITTFRKAGLYLSLIMMSLFTAYIVTITQFSEYVPCSCGGILENMTWNQHLIFNIFFVVLGITGIALYNHSFNNNNHHSRA